MTRDKGSTSSGQRSILAIMVKVSVGLTLITSVIAVLVLMVGRGLPSAGAIAFLAYYDGNADVYARDLARGTLANLTDNDAGNDNLAFSPDGRYLSFTSSSNGSFSQLYLKEVKCDGLLTVCHGGTRQLTHDTITGIAFSAWSPDGSQIAYVADNEIYALDIADGLTHNLTQNPAADGAPLWSPDGSHIAFGSLRDSDMAEIYLANSDGSHVQRITHNAVWDGYLAWSPDGTQLAFMTPYNADHYGLMVLDVRDGSVRTIVPDLENVIPLWSLDGRQLEYWVGYSQSSYLYAVDMPQGGTPKLMASLTGSNQYFTLLPTGQFAFLHGPNEMESDELYFLDGDQLRLIARHSYPPVWWP